jgi:5-methyltetrahydropteroyltriglutamate--homocysteine methyltransferase
VPDRILTTHAGSLPRPPALLDALVAQDRGEPVSAAALEAMTRAAVADAVARQAATGLDVIGDGEMSKISYVNYLKHRLTGFGAPAPLAWTPADLLDHPEYGGGERAASKTARVDPPACRGPLEAGDPAPLAADLAHLAAALAALAGGPRPAFLNAPSPGVVSMFLPNRYYPDEDAYVEALAEALRPEYEAIHKAGYTLQLDCPDLAMNRHMSFAGKPVAEFRRAAGRNLAALNHALRNIPADAMRLHICWGNYPGPHTHDVPVAEIADIVFAAKPRALLFEAANPAHAHEWADYKSFRIPDDLVLVPGVVETTTNRVEHPRLVAERLLRFAEIVGRERVMAGTDCGFATLASLPRVWPSVVWTKLKALVDGAAMASDRLWGRRG